MRTDIAGNKIRLEAERREHQTLSPFAAFSDCSRGRLKPEAPCPIRAEFARDRDRIVHSKAFRRLKHKTQVFLSPDGDHYRTRLTHTLEVSQVARTIARALSLNEDLTEAIALGHDLGHTPFGHAGERALSKASGMVQAQRKQRSGGGFLREGRGGLPTRSRRHTLPHRRQGGKTAGGAHRKYATASPI